MLDNDDNSNFDCGSDIEDDSESNLFGLGSNSDLESGSVDKGTSRPNADNRNADYMSNIAVSGSSDDDIDWEAIDRHMDDRAPHKFAFRLAVNSGPTSQVDPLTLLLIL